MGTCTTDALSVSPNDAKSLQREGEQSRLVAEWRFEQNSRVEALAQIVSLTCPHAIS